MKIIKYGLEEEEEQDDGWGFFVELDDVSKYIIKDNKENKFNKYKKYYKQILPKIKEEEEEQDEEIQRQDEELYRLEEELYKIEEDELFCQKIKIEKIEKKVKNKIKSLFCYLGATIFILSLLAILC